MARERSLLEGAHEVRYAEIAFRPRHPADVEEVRDAVDALVARKLALPEPAPLPQPEPPAAPEIDPATRAALAPVVPGVLVAAQTRYRVSEGEVVEAVSEKDGARRKGLYLLSGGSARPFDDVASRIDALPEPTLRMPAPIEEAPPLPTPAPSEEPKRKGFGLRRGKTSEAPEAKPADEAPAGKGGFASRFRSGRAKEPAAEPAPAEPDAPPAEAAPGDEGKPQKRRFPFGRK